MKDSEKNYIDEWLQKQIKKVSVLLSLFYKTRKVNGSYITQVHLHKDILTNLQVELVKRYLKVIDNF